MIQNLINERITPKAYINIITELTGVKCDTVEEAIEASDAEVKVFIITMNKKYNALLNHGEHVADRTKGFEYIDTCNMNNAIEMAQLTMNSEYPVFQEVVKETIGVLDYIAA